MAYAVHMFSGVRLASSEPGFANHLPTAIVSPSLMMVTQLFAKSRNWQLFRQRNVREMRETTAVVLRQQEVKCYAEDDELGMTQDPLRIESHLVNDDPTFVSLYTLAQEATLTLEAAIGTLWESDYLTTATPPQRALFKITGILITLAVETSHAARELGLNNLPRAMNMLTRSTFEYSVRLRWYHLNPDIAERHMDSLPRDAHKEMQKAQGHFTDETKARLVASYKDWQKQHADIDKSFNDENFTNQIAPNVLTDNRMESEFFPFYSIPSIMAHGKPLAYVDTIREIPAEPNTVVVTLDGNSRQFNVHTELAKVSSIVTELVGLLTSWYHLNAAPYNELIDFHNAALKDAGFEVKSVTRAASRALMEPATEPQPEA
ncbi:MAG TPA: hypothetical protein VK669_10755 [Candidatus Limnocylindrales bacterium]|nr:hypothetical protein [Candidatus Limnocylindrales bacterium]